MVQAGTNEHNWLWQRTGASVSLFWPRLLPKPRGKPLAMLLKDRLAPMIARDSRFSFEAYEFVLQALEQALKAREAGKKPRRGKQASASPTSRSSRASRHVTGAAVCEAACEIARDRYGLLGLYLLNRWGIYTSGDLGEIVFNLVESGELCKSPRDSRADFEGAVDLEESLRRTFAVLLDQGNP